MNLPETLDKIQDFEDFSIKELNHIKLQIRATLNEDKKLRQYLENQMPSEQFKEYKKSPENEKPRILYEFAESFIDDYMEMKETFKNLGPSPML